MPKLTLTITPASAERLEIEVDGHLLNAAVVGEPIPLNPGTHGIGVHASGYATFQRSVRIVEADAKQLVVKLRTEVEGPDQNEGAPAIGSGRSASQTQRTIGLATGGVGMVGLVVGSVFGLVAKSTYNSAVGYCPSGPPSPCSQQGSTKAGRRTVRPRFRLLLSSRAARYWRVEQRSNRTSSPSPVVN